MKLQELNLNEMKEINGGGLFGNNDSSSSGDLLGNIGIGQLISIQTYSKDGDKETASSFSVGKDINLDLGGMLSNWNS